MKICATSFLLKNALLHEKKPDIGNGVEHSTQKICPECSTRWPSTQYFRSILQVIYQLSNAGIRVTVDLHREYVSLAPFQLPNRRTAFTPQRVAVETTEGVVVEERTNPRAAFAGHTRQTPWDALHFIYFASYTMWTYLTVPFSLTWAGFEVAEIEPWQEQDETWRRLKVKFPPHIASHSTEQTFYFGDDGLLRRHDYDVEISGNTPAAHCVSDYQDVSGIMIPTKRRVFIRQPDNAPALDTVLIAIDLSDIRFA